MHRKFLFAFIAFTALVLSLNTNGLLAQGRGQGRGRPAGAGQPAADNPHKPATPGASQNPSGQSGRPTVEQQISRNPHLAATLQTLLPGANLQTASAGFRNLGEFVAAAHVSHNLNIPFDQLKSKTTGSAAMSLGQAIHDLNPAVDANAEAKKASRSADAEIKASRGKKPSS
jgi:hypothetical protein